MGHCTLINCFIRLQLTSAHSPAHRPSPAHQLQPPRIANLPVGSKDRNMEMCKQLFLHADYQLPSRTLCGNTGGRKTVRPQAAAISKPYNGQDRLQYTYTVILRRFRVTIGTVEKQ